MRKNGAASAPQPAAHCQLNGFEAASASTSVSQNHCSPRRQSIPRFFTSRLAETMRTRLCIHPVSHSSRWPASTSGKPVRPRRHASSSAASPQREPRRRPRPPQGERRRPHGQRPRPATTTGRRRTRVADSPSRGLGGGTADATRTRASPAPTRTRHSRPRRPAPRAESMPHLERAHVPPAQVGREAARTLAAGALARVGVVRERALREALEGARPGARAGRPGFGERRGPVGIARHEPPVLEGVAVRQPRRPRTLGARCRQRAAEVPRAQLVPERREDLVVPALARRDFQGSWSSDP